MFNADRIPVWIDIELQQSPGRGDDTARVPSPIALADILMDLSVFPDSIVGRNPGLFIGKPGVGSLERTFHDVDHDRLGPESFSPFVSIRTPNPLDNHACLRIFFSFSRYLLDECRFYSERRGEIISLLVYA